MILALAVAQGAFWWDFIIVENSAGQARYIILKKRPDFWP
jgi:hypothetical protein